VPADDRQGLPALIATPGMCNRSDCVQSRANAPVRIPLGESFVCPNCGSGLGLVRFETRSILQRARGSVRNHGTIAVVLAVALVGCIAASLALLSTSTTTHRSADINYHRGIPVGADARFAGLNFTLEKGLS